MSLTQSLGLWRSLGATETGLAYLTKAYLAPSRLAVAGHVPNRVTRYASRKNGTAIQTESATVELPYVRMCEINPDVLEFYDQAPSIYYESVDSLGRRYPTHHKPDIIDVRTVGITLVECKNSDKIRELIRKHPALYVQEQGVVRCPVLERKAQEYGFSYAFFDADLYTQVEKANLELASNLFRSAAPGLCDEHLIKARAMLQSGALTIVELKQRLKIADAAEIVMSVVFGQLHIAFKHHLLSDSEWTCVYANKQDAGRVDLLLAETCSARAVEQTSVVIRSLTPTQLKTAAQTLQRLEDSVQAGRPLSRQDRRYRSRLAEARESGELALIAVVPKYRSRGTGPRLHETVIDEAGKILNKRYYVAHRPTLKSVHSSLLVVLEPFGLSISLEAFRLFEKKQGARAALLSREGIRAVYAKGDPVPQDSRQLRLNLSWQRAHVDSTEIPDKVWVGHHASEFLAKPTLYTLVDDGNGYIYAVWICFHGGRNALACLLRDCIRRHGKLPHCIAADQGSENISVFWQTSTAFLACDSEQRPPSAAKFGSAVEACHSRQQKLVFNNLPGNTINDKVGRGSDAPRRSNAHAKLDIYDLITLVDSSRDYLNERPIGNCLASPDEQFEEDNTKFPEMGIKVAMSLETLITTAIPTGTRQYLHGRGVRFYGTTYCSETLCDRALDKHKLNIRYEPYDPTCLYAEANGQWHVMHSTDHARVQHLDVQARIAELHYLLETGPAREQIKRDIDMKNAHAVRDKFLERKPNVTVVKPVAPTPEVDHFAFARGLEEHELAD